MPCLGFWPGLAFHASGICTSPPTRAVCECCARRGPAQGGGASQRKCCHRRQGDTWNDAARAENRSPSMGGNTCSCIGRPNAHPLSPLPITACDGVSKMDEGPHGRGCSKPKAIERSAQRTLRGNQPYPTNPTPCGVWGEGRRVPASQRPRAVRTVSTVAPPLHPPPAAPALAPSATSSSRHDSAAAQPPPAADAAAPHAASGPHPRTTRTSPTRIVSAAPRHRHEKWMRVEGGHARGGGGTRLRGATSLQEAVCVRLTAPWLASMLEEEEREASISYRRK